MNKNIILAVSVAFVIVLLFASTIGAFSWSDLLTGRQVSDISKSIEWIENDGGISEFEADVIYSANFKRWKTDTCYSSGTVREFYKDGDRVRSKNIRCLNGCETVLLTLPFGTIDAGQCKEVSEKLCEEFGDEGDDPFVAGVVLSNTDNKQLSNDVGQGNNLVEYYCDENGVKQQKSYPCYGLIQKEPVVVEYSASGLNVNTQVMASYCMPFEVTCSKEGKILTYTAPDGDEKTKRDRCAASDNEADEGVDAPEGSRYIVSFQCNIEEYDLDADGDVDMDDLALDEDASAGVLGILTGETKPFERVDGDICDNGCKVTDEEVMCKDPSCVETDNRKDLSVASISRVLNQNGILQYMGRDVCVGDDMVLEFWCSSGSSKDLSAKTYQCPTGKTCAAGACVETGNSGTVIALNSNSNPSQTVSLGGNNYLIELVSASDSAVVIKVTDANGNSDQKEINEAASMEVQGLTVAVIIADETNLTLSATIRVSLV